MGNDALSIKGTLSLRGPSPPSAQLSYSSLEKERVCGCHWCRDES